MPGRATRACPHSEPEVLRQRPHLVLPHGRLQQGMPDTVLSRRAQPGPPVTHVVGVGAGQHGGESAAPATKIASRTIRFRIQPVFCEEE